MTMFFFARPVKPNTRIPVSKRSQGGFTIIESLIYVAILSLVAVSLVYSIVALVQNYKKIQVRKEVADNAYAALDAIAEEIRSARSIYASTSVFAVNPGQLSLKTLRAVPAGEDRGYADFYLDNKRIYMKREGAAAFPVTSERVAVSQLKFTRIGTGTSTPSVTIDLKMGPNLDGNNMFYFTDDFSATAGLR